MSTQAIRNAQAVLRDVKALEDLIATQEDTIRTLIGQKAHWQRVAEGKQAPNQAPPEPDDERTLGRVQAVLDVLREQEIRRRDYVRLKLASINELPSSQVMSVAGVAELLEEILEQ